MRNSASHFPSILVHSLLQASNSIMKNCARGEESPARTLEVRCTRSLDWSERRVGERRQGYAADLSGPYEILTRTPSAAKTRIIIDVEMCWVFRLRRAVIFVLDV